MLAMGADSAASLAEIGFRRIPMLALPPAAAGPAAAVVPAPFPMEGMGRLVDLGIGGRLALDKAAQLLRKLRAAEADGASESGPPGASSVDAVPQTAGRIHKRHRVGRRRMGARETEFNPQTCPVTRLVTRRE